MPHFMAGGWTAEMLPALPDDGNRYEVIDGELYVSPSPLTVHQAVALQLAAVLLGYLKPSRIAAVIPDIDVTVDERTMVRPDIVVAPFVSGKLPERPVDARTLLLVVEILSPSSLRLDRREKRALYARVAVPEYWIVDIDGQTIERWRAGTDIPELFRDRMTWQPDPSKAALVIELGELFAGT